VLLHQLRLAFLILSVELDKKSSQVRPGQAVLSICLSVSPVRPQKPTARAPSPPFPFPPAGRGRPSSGPFVDASVWAGLVLSGVDQVGNAQTGTEGHQGIQRTWGYVGICFVTYGMYVCRQALPALSLLFVIFPASG
jgi:hypothetical protein